MLTDAQLLTLKAAILAETNPTFVQWRDVEGATGMMAEWFNEPSTFVVWKSSVPKNEVGKAFQASALAAITAGNNDKLNNFAAWNETVYPARADQRAFFDDIFSVAAGAQTRANLLALWKRFATRGERIYATGTGSDAAPGSLIFEGRINDAHVVRALTQV